VQLEQHQHQHQQHKFLLTHPSRGATTGQKIIFKGLDISTHTPLAGCNAQISRDYNLQRISTHTPLAGCNISTFDLDIGAENFYSHTPRGVQQC